MKSFAVIKDNVVTNIIVAETLEDTKPIGFCVEYTADNPAAIGWSFDGTSFHIPVSE